MAKLNIIMKVLEAIVSLFRGISCKTTSCCGSKCSSECGNKKSADSIDAEGDEQLEDKQTPLQTSS